MKLLSIKTPQDVAERWKKANSRDGNWSMSRKLIQYSGKDFEQIYYQLLTATSIKETEVIIGNKSWSGYSCSECERRVPEVVDVTPDYNYEGLKLCKDCLQKAIGLLA